MIQNVDKETFERVWKIVGEIGVQERHFNSLQSTYRGMASAWLLATFAGIGTISLSSRFGIDGELLVAGIALAGAIGIGLLWVADLLVYHRLLDSCFIEGLILEERHPWLPRLRHNMMRTQNGSGVLFRIVGFYIGPIGLLILLAGGSVTLWLYKASHYTGAAIAIALAGAMALGTAALMRRKTENTDAIKQRLADARQPDRALSIDQGTA